MQDKLYFPEIAEDATEIDDDAHLMIKQLVQTTDSSPVLPIGDEQTKSFDPE